MRRIKKLTYAQVVALGYVCIILLGGLLLSLPIATRDGSTDILTALFTSTSASCVTGLVVVDTYTHWTIFGQCVILVLIQIGGLGFFSFLALMSLFLRKRIGLKTRSFLKESISGIQIGGIVRLFKKLLIGTLLFEGGGAVILSFVFVPRIGLWPGIWAGVFHSVSAFCNAGFDICGRFGAFGSLTTFTDSPLLMLCICILIIVGGIGFFVWDDLYTHKFNFRHYQLHTKIVLFATGLLIALGTLLFFVYERDNTLAGMGFGRKLITSLFCAVTPRTAGFNVVDNAALSPASRILTMVLMIIGGSPGSTAGGIKTTTVVVMFVAMWSHLSAQSGDDIFGRRLEDSAVHRAVSVVTFHLSLSVIAGLAISAVEKTLSSSAVFFEVLSAIGTVGLSVGITTSLSVASQIIIMLLMFSGRMGSITFMSVFMEPHAARTIQKPEERISIG